MKGKKIIHLIMASSILVGVTPFSAAAQSDSTGGNAETAVQTSTFEEVKTSETSSTDVSEEVDSTNEDPDDSKTAADLRKEAREATKNTQNIVLSGIKADGKSINVQDGTITINSNVQILEGSMQIADAKKEDWYFKNSEGEENQLTPEDLQLDSAFAHGEVQEAEVDNTEKSKINFKILLDTDTTEIGMPDFMHLPKGVIKVLAANNRYEQDLSCTVDVNDLELSIKETKIDDTDPEKLIYTLKLTLSGGKPIEKLTKKDIRFNGVLEEAQLLEDPKINKEQTEITLRFSKAPLKEGEDPIGHIILNENRLQYPDGQKLDRAEIIYFKDDYQAAHDSDEEVQTSSSERSSVQTTDSSMDSSEITDSTNDSGSNASALEQASTDSSKETTSSKESAATNEQVVRTSDDAASNGFPVESIIRGLISSTSLIEGMGPLEYFNVLETIISFLITDGTPSPQKQLVDMMKEIKTDISKLEQEVSEGIKDVIGAVKTTQLENRITADKTITNKIAEEKYDLMLKDFARAARNIKSGNLTDEEVREQTAYITNVYTTQGAHLDSGKFVGVNDEFLKTFLAYADQVTGRNAVDTHYANTMNVYHAYQTANCNWTKESVPLREAYNKMAYETFNEYYTMLFTAMVYDYKVTKQQLTDAGLLSENVEPDDYLRVQSNETETAANNGLSREEIQLLLFRLNQTAYYIQRVIDPNDKQVQAQYPKKEDLDKAIAYYAGDYPLYDTVLHRDDQGKIDDGKYWQQSMSEQKNINSLSKYKELMDHAYKSESDWIDREKKEFAENTTYSYRVREKFNTDLYSVPAGDLVTVNVAIYDTRKKPYKEFYYNVCDIWMHRYSGYYGREYFEQEFGIKKDAKGRYEYYKYAGSNFKTGGRPGIRVDYKQPDLKGPEANKLFRAIDYRENVIYAKYVVDGTVKKDGKDVEVGHTEFHTKPRTVAADLGAGGFIYHKDKDTVIPVEELRSPKNNKVTPNLHGFAVSTDIEKNTRQDWGLWGSSKSSYFHITQQYTGFDNNEYNRDGQGNKKPYVWDIFTLEVEPDPHGTFIFREDQKELIYFTIAD